MALITPLGVYNALFGILDIARVPAFLVKYKMQPNKVVKVR